MKEPEKRSRQMSERRSASKLGFDIGNIGAEDLLAGERRLAGTKETAVGLGKNIGVAIGRAPEHHTIEISEVRFGFIERTDTAVDDNRQIGVPMLQAIDPLIIERGNFTILARGKALKPGLAGMHDEGSAACT